ncbi:hypothetical protein DASC09_023660 [Saccharomycopsis crataegensis]|uniref:Uncharacterized protein n=1 Tax=Saccharomycopsis crataegensis TaxID=43959 RepID=A0AAV5QK85_9ASCO|nr:hypothetical protein DASC09_023660 [Saccharomycopsis crataegensis]
MKFGKYFEKELASSDVPKEWAENAIQYKALKKRIKRFAEELMVLGLSKETMGILLSASEVTNATINTSDTKVIDISMENDNNNGDKGDNEKEDEEEEDGPVSLQSLEEKIQDISLEGTDLEDKEPILYNLKFQIQVLEDDAVQEQENHPIANYLLVEDQQYVKPKLIVVLNNDNDEYSKEIRQKIIKYIEHTRKTDKIVEVKEDQIKLQNIEKLKNLQRVRITIDLHEDDEFFQTIFTELTNLQQLKIEHEQKMTKEIETISDTIGSLSSPSKWRTDLDSWREIFEIYLENRIFYVTDDIHGERKFEDSSKRLQQFEKEINSTDLVQGFKHKKSKVAYEAFYQLNVDLLQAMKFHHLNKLAVTKILKKFDKQTALAVRTQIPDIMSQKPFINESFINTLYGAISEKLVSVIPQIEDYDCPICFTIAYRPIRLKCSHVFCVQCLVNLQRQKKDECPVCRSPAVMEATSDNLDIELQDYMKTYFPKQVKEKQKERMKTIEAETYYLAYRKAKYSGEGCCIQ